MEKKNDFNNPGESMFWPSEVKIHFDLENTNKIKFTLLKGKFRTFGRAT